MPSQTKPNNAPSSLACMPCRRRHLKCDALMPACTRCQNTGSDCRYVRSRRGLRPKSDNHSPDLFDAGLPMFAGDDDPLSDLLSASGLPDLDYSGLAGSPADGLPSTQAMFPALSTPQTLVDLPVPSIPDADDALVFPPIAQPDSLTQDLAYDPMLQLYYQGFHRSHPFVVPRRALNSPLARRIPESTLSVMRYIGAHYHPNPSLQDTLRGPAYAGFADGSAFAGFRVQNMLLLAIVEHAHGNEECAQHTLQMAVNLALEVGMNRGGFAGQNAWGSPVLEESWRRTYWELYVVNGVLAAMRDQKSFVLHSQNVGVGLPCEEDTYNACNVIPPSTESIHDLKTFWSRSADDQRFSSFAYRIEAARALGSVLALNHSLDINEDALVETTEASLVASLLHFPVSQGDPYSSTDYDDMTFQAQMILYLGMIHLHHPRSNMRLASFHAQTSCTRLRALDSNTSKSTRPIELDLHSQKLLRAANMLSNLATLPGAVKHRTPFFSCALAMAVIVHVAGCLMVAGADGEKEDSVRARIQLGLGALNVLGKVWPLAAKVRRQLVGMYHEVGLGCK